MTSYTAALEITIMDFHAHPIEIIWCAFALGALGGTLHALLLARDDRVYQRVHKALNSLGAAERLIQADNNLWSEMFRFTLSIIQVGGSMVSLFSEPATMAEFQQFPQILSHLISGMMISVVLVIWAVFDIYFVRANPNGTSGSIS
jgi:hypothetical protein